jgi:hypothetical protein
VNAALEMAALEHELGVRSTYFLMTRSPLYNAMSRHSHRCIQQIIRYGHHLGLHYDQGFDPRITGQNDSALINAEADWLEYQFESQISAVSFHQPGNAVLQGHVDTGQRLNTYDPRLSANFSYFSDSNRKLTFLAGSDASGIKDAAKKLLPSSIQLLIHPIWWVYDEDSTEKVWDKAIVSNFTTAQLQLLATEQAYGAERKLGVSK